MKKLTIAFTLILISTIAISQNKTDSLVRQTTGNKPTVVDSNSIALFSVNDLVKFKELVLKTPHDQYIKIDPTQLLNTQIGWLIQNLKPKTQPITGKK